MRTRDFDGIFLDASIESYFNYAIARSTRSPGDGKIYRVKPTKRIFRITSTSKRHFENKKHFRPKINLYKMTTIFGCGGNKNNVDKPTRYAARMSIVRRPCPAVVFLFIRNRYGSNFLVNRDHKITTKPIFLDLGYSHMH